MLPPVLEIFVIWHPGDDAGREVAEEIFNHFHGTAYSGLIGGAIEVYVRSEGWRSSDDAPRQIPFPGSPTPSDIPAAALVAVVPILGDEFAAAVQSRSGAWWDFARELADAGTDLPDRVGVFPLLVDAGSVDETELGRLFGRFQRIAEPFPDIDQEPAVELRCRDLAQGITQLANDAKDRLRVFISHTKRARVGEEEDVSELIELVRKIIADTRLQHFFDANDLQPGQDWDEELRANAANSAMLALRTDLYASREWCQREMLIAKRNGMPIVILDSLGIGEERGSFLMDHVPRIPVRESDDGWNRADIRRGLNLLVDECLKRALWNIQKSLAANRPELHVAWWAPHAPEPITLAQWLQDHDYPASSQNDAVLRILHPDPPLGPEEKSALQQIAALGGCTGAFDVMTPRMLAGRGA